MNDKEIISLLSDKMLDWPLLSGSPEEYAAELLPVVRQVAEQRAAEELLKQARINEARGFINVAIGLRARAAALTATPNHGRNAA